MDGGEITLRVTPEGLRDHAYLAFQMWCAVSATRKAASVMVAGQCVSLAPGEFVFTKPLAMEALELSDWQVRRCLDLALAGGLVALVRKSNRFVVLSLGADLRQDLRQKSPHFSSEDKDFQDEGSQKPPAKPPAQVQTSIFQGGDLRQNLRQESPHFSSEDGDFQDSGSQKPPARPPAAGTQEEVLREEELSGRTSKSKSKANFLPPEAVAVAELLARLILANNPANTQLVPHKREATVLRWAGDLERLNRLDGASWKQIEWMIHWTQRDEFWRTNILSGTKLREKWDQLVLKAVPKTPGPGGGNKGKATITELVQAQLERLRAKKQEEGNGQGRGNPDGGPSLLALPFGAHGRSDAGGLD